MDAKQKKQIEMLYLEMYDMLVAYAYSSFKNTALAEEAVQETFRIACQKPDQLHGSANPRGWLVLTLRNTINNMSRSRATAKMIVEQYLVAQLREYSFCEDRIDLSILYENVADMEEFKLLSEMAIEGRSHEEMARVRGISVSACRKRVQRAKEILQRKIKFDVTL